MTAPDRAGDLCTCLRCQDERRENARAQFGDHPWAQVVLRGPTTPGWSYACAVCDNKRCPHHEDHRFVCTRSNEPGQIRQLIDARDAALADLAALDADLIVMAPDASAVTEEAVEAAARFMAQAELGKVRGAGQWALFSVYAHNILTAALPHLTAAKDTDHGMWEDAARSAMRLAEQHAKTIDERDAEIERLRKAIASALDALSASPDTTVGMRCDLAAQILERTERKTKQ